MGSGYSSDTTVKLVASKQAPRCAPQHSLATANQSPGKSLNAAEDLRSSMKIIEAGIDKLEKELSCPVW
jgi:hypothetical protein